jgi:hypothetical protein
MGWLDSLFTPPGTNRRNSQLDQQHTASGYSSNLLPGEFNYQQQLQGFRSSQLPTAENAVNSLGQWTTQQGRDQESNAYTNWAQAAARSRAAQGYSGFAGNQSLQQGYGLDQMNQANSQSAQYQGQINSPEAQQAALQAYMGGLNALSPNYNGLSQLTGNVYGQPTVPVGQGIGDFLGNLAGQYATTFLPKKNNNGGK